MEYNIISSGSKGNCVLLERYIAIDMGVPWKLIEPHVNSLRLVLLTHMHGDHFNRATVRRLASQRPALRWGCAEWMAAAAVECGVKPEKIDLHDMDTSMSYGELTIEAFPLRHNVPNCGWKLRLPSGERVIYATDTASMLGVEAPNYDLYFIEADYGEEEIVERIRRKQETGEYIHEYDAMQNHLSREAAENWLYTQMGPNSAYVLMHINHLTAKAWGLHKP
jgi:Cft2 family RNA processing exonuclease